MPLTVISVLTFPASLIILYFQITSTLFPGFGLTVCGGSDVPHKEGDSGIFVSEVSRSDIDLCVGDRILEV